MQKTLRLPYKSHPYRPETNELLHHGFILFGFSEFCDREQRTVSFESLTFMGKVQARELDPPRYCQTSISVQLLSGKTRKFSPAALRPLKRFQSSGLWFFGSHCPNASRCEKNLSFARAFLSSFGHLQTCVKGFILNSFQQVWIARNFYLPPFPSPQWHCHGRLNPAPGQRSAGH